MVILLSLCALNLSAQKIQESIKQPGYNAIIKKFPPQNITIESGDGLVISGNLYEVMPNSPTILLCHQAGYNKAEYLDIAPRLNEMGYNCLAIDQRSGGTFAGQPNETATSAVLKGMDNSMLDAKQDLKAAIDYLVKRYAKKVIIWGSSYSSSLALFELTENEKVMAAIAFSPGDYFGNDAPTLSTILAKTNKPFFVTSSKAESVAIKMLFKELKMNKNQKQFIPSSEGFHGSRVLWLGQKGAEEYWAAVTDFLALLK